MKKNLKFILPGILIVTVLAWIFWPSRNKKPEPQTQTPPRKVEEINKLAIKERPYVTLTPRADGREVSLTIDNVTNASKVEYELEYQAEALIQGVFGNIDFSQEAPPVSKDLLFGSCSKGKCKYDEGVNGGSLTLHFEGGDQPYVLKSDFNLQTMADREGIFTSKDAKASLDVSSSLSDSTYLMIFNTMGLPSALEGEVVAGPYAFSAATSPTLKNAQLTIKSKEDLTAAKLMFWTGKTWQELKSSLSEGQISAPVNNLGTFVLVK